MISIIYTDLINVQFSPSAHPQQYERNNKGSVSLQDDTDAVDTCSYIDLVALKLVININLLILK